MKEKVVFFFHIPSILNQSKYIIFFNTKRLMEKYFVKQ